MEIVSFLFSLTFLLVPRPCGREREVIRMVREDKRNRKKKRETAYAQCVVSPTLLREREKDQELTVGEDTHLRFSGFTLLFFQHQPTANDIVPFGGVEVVWPFTPLAPLCGKARQKRRVPQRGCPHNISTAVGQSIKDK